MVLFTLLPVRRSIDKRDEGVGGNDVMRTDIAPHELLFYGDGIAALAALLVGRAGLYVYLLSSAPLLPTKQRCPKNAMWVARFLALCAREVRQSLALYRLCWQVTSGRIVPYFTTRYVTSSDPPISPHRNLPQTRCPLASASESSRTGGPGGRRRFGR